MVLYAAKLKENAKPVADLQVDKKEAAKLKRQEKARLKKEAKEQEDLELQKQQMEAEQAKAEKEAEIKAAEEAIIAKKEAQKEKRRLARLNKKANTESVATPSEPATIDSSEATLVQDKPKRTRKRKQDSIDEQIDQAVEKLPKKSKKDDAPPEWFKKYVAGVKNEESHHQSPRKAKKAITKEANQVAAQQWNNGLVRDRVRNEVDQHMSRMYQMIFNRGL